MSDFITVKLSGLRELDQALNELDLKTRKQAMRPALRTAMKPVLSRIKSNVEAISDTGGLEETVKMTASFAKGNLQKSGKQAAAIGRVSVGSSRKREGKTGHQALQVEFGTSDIPAKPVIRPAVTGHEKTIINTFAKELGRQIERIARRVRRN